MKAKEQYNQAMEGVAPLYTRVIPYGVYQTLYAGDNRMMTQNQVATQYRMTPSAIAWLVTQNILMPRFIVTEDNSDRVIMKLFASSDVDFVASMRLLKGWDYAGLSEYWRGLFASSDVDFVAEMRLLKGWDYAGLSEYWQSRGVEA